ncbi:WXG100 family type VII secretion target [Streptomyces sp. ODS28]|uniref:WXG100 family type VII secretion target n=1 Tax=Streptomyces sp. ODS28 TaxID=3136688 RepID=UPI0031EE2780
MSGGQKLNDERLNQTKRHIEGVIDSMDKQVKDLESVLEMLRTQWRGVGAGQFSKAQHDLNQYHVRLQKLMRGVRDAVDRTQKGSGANDDAVAASMRGIDLNGDGGGNGQISAGSYGETGQNMAQYSKLSQM